MSSSYMTLFRTISKIKEGDFKGATQITCSDDAITNMNAISLAIQ